MNVKLLDLQSQYLPIRNEIRRAIDEVCDAQALCLGPAVERFEKHLAEYSGTKHAIGVSSGTDALLCSLMALDLKPGDEVLVPSFTFFATAGCVARLGATPVFCDIDPATFNLDHKDAAKRITPRTKAIMPVHLFGQCADMDGINALAKTCNLKVIEDAAQAIGAKRHDKPACSLSLAGCLSFYPTKNLGAFGDAGAICTNDDSFADTCRKLRVHGSGHTYHHELIGGMFRMAGIQGAVLDVKLKYLNDWHEARRRNAALYDELLADSKIITPKIDPANRSIYNQYIIRVQNRDQVKQTLASAGISTAVYYPTPLHLQPCFAYLNAKEGSLPQSERACKEVLALPIYPELPEEHLRYVAAELLKATA
ncbi:MAG TPA: DegT/DnrJ/EryC1/StrS family aminotransferase [Tepidisphaeraceae bacterium]|jgi:dTDP-4-amino-4,6-dideoxygalactose transaminase|nr:DegT/DnrJ/EryC1/StrS family aminotransferase [Tepidisphaeraceae bacterium]